MLIRVSLNNEAESVQRNMWRVSCWDSVYQDRFHRAAVMQLRPDVLRCEEQRILLCDSVRPADKTTETDGFNGPWRHRTSTLTSDPRSESWSVRQTANNGEADECTVTLIETANTLWTGQDKTQCETTWGNKRQYSCSPELSPVRPVSCFPALHQTGSLWSTCRWSQAQSVRRSFPPGWVFKAELKSTNRILGFWGGQGDRVTVSQSLVF